MLGSAWLGPPWFQLAMLATALVTTWELAAVLGRLGPMPGRGVLVVAVGLLCGAALWPDQSVLWLVALALLILVPGFAWRRGRAGGAPAARALLVLVYPGLCLALAMRIPDGGNGFGDIVFLYGVLEANDSAALLTGRYLGKRKAWPHLSPGKTWAGCIGGLITAVLVGMLLSFTLPEVTWPWGAVLGLGLGLAGQAADLAASAIKRRAGVKDFARHIPTQGGVLDIYDAFILVTPFWWFLLLLLRG